MADPSVSPAGLRLVKLLVGNPPMTIAQLIKATGVTRTAVTEQLGELVAGGFVERRLERLPGRGRPHHLYSTTHAALLLLFADTQRLVVPAIWRAVAEAGGEVLTRRVMPRVARQLAEHYGTRIDEESPRKRLQQMSRVLGDEGALVDVVEDGGSIVLRKRSCPFISMLDENRSVCCVDEEMMSFVVGHPVRRIEWRHEGDPCCTFELRNGQ
jgi:predicted ArsR family transcriptional regulator